jgi:large subunit ribosomal protein L22
MADDTKKKNKAAADKPAKAKATPKAAKAANSKAKKVANAPEASRAVLKNVRIGPRKVRLVLGLVRGKPVQYALDLLKVTNKKAAPIVAKMITSALANAKEKATVDVDRLVVGECFANGGTSMKRWLPRAQGRATPIQKRSSHITVKLKEI